MLTLMCFVKVFHSVQPSSTRAVSVSWNASLLSSNPLLTVYTAEFSLYTGITAIHKIETVSMVIPWDLQA